MRKVLFLLGALIASLTASASESFSAGFEGESLAADGWTTYSSGAKSQWSQITYTAETFFSSTTGTIKIPSNGGAKAAKSLSGALNAIGGVNPSSWLISPKIKVGKGESLSFMLAYNAGYNGNANVKSDDVRTKFDILISTTTADTTAFSDVVFHKINKSVSQYANYNVDLSKYEGQEIYIAFHEYGTPAKTPWLTNVLYLDNIKVSSEKAPDLSIITSPTFKSGLVKEQAVSLSITNYGADASGIKMNYQIGDGETVTETVNSVLASGDTLAYTFTKNAVFTKSGSQTVKVWCETDGDTFTDNNADSATVNIYEVAQIPYAMTEESATTDLASSYTKRSGRNYYGWAYYDNTKAWVYTSSSTVSSYLYTTKGYSLTKGKLRIKTTATATASPASMNVYLTKVEKEFGDPVATVDMKVSLDASDNIFLIDVPEDGDYIIALQPTISGQVALFGLEISLPIEDIVAREITAPAASLLVNNEVTVSAKFRNDGQYSHSGVKVSYQYGDNAAVTETLPDIESGAEISYTFDKKLDLSAAATKDLKVWCSLEGDGNLANDTVTKSIFTYEAKALPYSTSFENDEDKLTWTTINVDDDDVYWGIEPMTVAIDGKNAMYLNSLTNIKSNDLAVTPALTVKKGEKYRISFYYAKTSAITSRTSTLAVYLSTGADVDSVKNGTLIAEYAESGNAYRYANAFFTAPADGTYYIALYSLNGTSDLVIDDFRIDQSSEVVMIGAESSVSDKAYELPDGNVTAKFVNAGLSEISDIKLTYTAIATDSKGDTISTKTVEETYSKAVASGDTVSYVFTEPVKFDKAGTYSITVSLSQSSDTDTKNNSYAVTGPTLFETKTAPVTLGFEDTNDNAAVKVSSTRWRVAMSTPYQGKYSIYHSGKADAAGDWIFLNRVNIPAGTYDFSYFWKTMTGNKNSTVRQSFSVYMGTDATAEAMTTKLYEFSDTINSDHKATKELMTLTIDKTANYFIGVKCTSTNSLGALILDQFSISDPVTGMEIPAESEYVADFATRENEWYHYHPTTTSSQWTAATADGDTYMTTKRTYTSYMGTWTTPGIYESPAFKLAKDGLYEVTYEYSIAATNSSNPLDGKSALSLYIADKDVPAAFSTVVAKGGEDYLSESLAKGTAKDTITVAADGVYYLGFIPESEVSAQFNLYSFKLKNLKVSGVSDIDANDGNSAVIENGKLIVAGDYETAYIYSVNGMLCASFNAEDGFDVSSLSKGIYLVKLTSGDKSTVVKIAVK